jgi:hypothetical protein
MLPLPRKKKKKGRNPGAPPWVNKVPSARTSELKLGTKFWRNLLLRRTVTQSCQPKNHENKSEDPSIHATSWMRKLTISEDQCKRKGPPVTSQQLQPGITARVQAKVCSSYQERGIRL